MSYYSNDIQVNNGNTLIRNGDFVVTSDDLPFIKMLFESTPGSWQYNENIGFDFNQYMGKSIETELIDDLGNDLVNYIAKFGYKSNIEIQKNGLDGLIINITIYNITEEPEYSFTLDFNITSAKVIVLDTNINKKSEKTETKVNKYIRRR